MKKANVIAGLMIVSLVCWVKGQDMEIIMKPEIYSNAAGESLKYRIYVSDGLDKDAKCSMLMFLHGAGERGDDNQKQLKHCVNNIISWSRENKEPVILVAPQCPADKWWINIQWGIVPHTMSESPALPLKLVLELCGKVVEKYPVDCARIYIVGLSMGGYGTWEAIQRRPGYFAAAIPVCGGGDEKLAERIRNVPVWAFHGSKDSTVPPERSRSMIEAMKKAGGKPSYTEYEGAGHDSWTKTFENPDVLRWLFDHKKKE